MGHTRQTGCNQDTGQTSQRWETGQTDLTFKFDFPGNLCRPAAFAILAVFYSERVLALVIEINQIYPPEIRLIIVTKQPLKKHNQASSIFRFLWIWFLERHPGLVDHHRGDELAHLDRLALAPLPVDEEVLVHQPGHQPLELGHALHLLLLLTTALFLLVNPCSLEKLPVKPFRTLSQLLTGDNIWRYEGDNNIVQFSIELSSYSKTWSLRSKQTQGTKTYPDPLLLES